MALFAASKLFSGRHKEDRDAAVAALMAMAAFAAEMPVKAPPMPPAPCYGWTGFYIGGNVGAVWANIHADIAARATTLALAPSPLLALICAIGFAKMTQLAMQTARSFGT